MLASALSFIVLSTTLSAVNSEIPHACPTNVSDNFIVVSNGYFHPGYVNEITNGEILNPGSVVEPVVGTSRPLKMSIIQFSPYG